MGQTVSLSIGGKMDTVHSQPLSVTGQVQYIQQQVWQHYQLQVEQSTNHQVVLQVDGIKIILTERRTPFHHLNQFAR
jgi:microcystin degradation protein MlrC